MFIAECLLVEAVVHVVNLPLEAEVENVVAPGVEGREEVLASVRFVQVSCDERALTVQQPPG